MQIWWTGVVTAAFVAGCGDSPPRPAAAPSVAFDAGAPVTGRCTGTEGAGGSGAADAGARYVIDSLQRPTTSSTARDFGCDLDGNGTPDNQLGNVGSALRGFWDQQDELDAWLEAGQLVELLRLQGGVPPVDGPIEVELVRGCHDMTTFDPAAAFGGMGVFRVAGQASHLSGTISNGVGSLSGDSADLALPFFVAPRERGAFVTAVFGVQLAHVRITPEGLMEGNLCGAMPQANVEGLVLPELANALHDRVALGGEAAVMLCQIFDLGARVCASRPEDCAHFGPTNPPPAGCMRPEDLAANPVVLSVLKADVTLQGRRGMSFGYRFTAVPARF